MVSATMEDVKRLVMRATDPTGNQGSAQQSSASASTLLSTLVPVLLVALVWFTIFLVLRTRFPRQYSPRSFMGALRPESRSPAMPNGLTNWFKNFFSTPDTYVLNHHTLDGYLLLRFLKMAVVSCLVGMAITWPVLFPINATGDAGKSQLDILSMSNIKNSTYRYFGHVACAYVFYGFLLFMITRESIYYINLRQAYLLSPLYSRRLSSRTVLFTSVPEEYTNETALRRMLGNAVKRVWIAMDTEELDDLVKQRDKAAFKLEAAETKLIKTANTKHIKAEKKKGGKNTETSALSHDVESGTLAAKYLTPKDRPTHRLKPLIGKKVDTIEWCRSELQKLIPQVDELQTKQRAHDAKRLNSVFVEFTTLAEAQAAYQSLTHHQVLHMAPRFTGITPGSIIWSNLRIKWWERVIRVFATTAFITALVIFWSIPVAAVGAISNLNVLINTSGFGWLGFLHKLPPVIFGLVSGLLPSILLAVLMALLPIILRLMARISGDPTTAAVELTTQNYYFAFQVVQVFLVATLSSGAAASVKNILISPSSAPSLLASSIPTASNFYLSYFCLQGLGVAAGMLVKITGLVVFMILGKLLDNTPRKMYKRWIGLSGIGWGTLFPVYTNLFVIAICYAIVAPLVLLFAAIGLYLFYLAFRYNLLFVNNAQIDTQGRVYPKALGHLFVGIYISEVCIIGLFAIGCGAGKGAIGPLILMILFLVFTVVYHGALNSALKPCIDYLPKSLEAEERRLMDDDSMIDEKGTNGDHSTDLGVAPHKKPNFITKFLKPHIYNDYATMRRLVPRDIHVQYEPEEEENAYYAPSITSPSPLLWIPRDPLGISRQEVADTSKVIPITDEGAELDSKGKIVWDSESGRPPIWQPTPYY